MIKTCDILIQLSGDVCQFCSVIFIDSPECKELLFDESFVEDECIVEFSQQSMCNWL